MRRPTDKTDAGPFRVTCVDDTGVSSTRTVKKWVQARRFFYSLQELSHMRYVILFENSEDETFRKIREEWSRKTCDTF